MKVRRTNQPASIGYFNLLKAYGIIVVLIFHTRILYFERPVDDLGMFSINGAGMMMMFFIVSGFGFYKRKPMRTLKGQVRLILLPYWGMCALILLERLVYNLIMHIPYMDNGGSLILTYILGLCVYPERKLAGIPGPVGTGFFQVLKGFPVSYIGLFWFILSLFTGWIIYNLIRQCKNEKYVRIFVIIAVLLGWLLPMMTDLWPYCIPQGLLTAGCLYAGEQLRTKKLLEKPSPPLFYIPAILWISISQIMGGGDMGTNTWNLGLADIISAFLIGIILIRIYVRIYRYIPENRLIDLLEVIGADSFIFFCIHGVERVTVPWYVIRRFIGNPWLGTFIYFILRCAFIICVYILIRKIRTGMRKRERNKSPRVKITLES